MTLNFQEIKKQVQRISRRLSSEIIRNRGYLDMKKRQPFRTAASIRISTCFFTYLISYLPPSPLVRLPGQSGAGHSVRLSTSHGYTPWNLSPSDRFRCVVCSITYMKPVRRSVPLYYKAHFQTQPSSVRLDSVVIRARSNEPPHGKLCYRTLPDIGTDSALANGSNPL